MGKFKKEKNRSARENSDGPNVHVKGENFYRDAKKVGQNLLLVSTISHQIL